MNDVGLTAGTTLAGGVSLNMPATIAAGDLLLAFCSNDNPSTTNMAISGWTQVYNEVVGSNVHKIACFAKIAAGSDTATLTGASQDYTATVKAIKRHGVTSIASDIKVATKATGTSTTPDAPSLDAGSTRNWLWLAHYGIDSSNTTVSDWDPANHIAVGKQASAASTSASISNTLVRQVAASSNDPGTMTISASRDWVAQQLAIPPVASGFNPLFWAFP
jgi:hypothetical protein